MKELPPSALKSVNRLIKAGLIVRAWRGEGREADRTSHGPDGEHDRYAVYKELRPKFGEDGKPVLTDKGAQSHEEVPTTEHVRTQWVALYALHRGRLQGWGTWERDKRKATWGAWGGYVLGAPMPRVGIKAWEAAMLERAAS